MQCLSGKTRGTCDDTACPSHGYCHDGCGDLRPLADQHHRPRNWTRDMPLMWKSGHSPDCKGSDRHQNDVPVERVRPLARWLHEETGSLVAAAAVAGLSQGTFDIICYSRSKKGVHPKSAAAIVAGVLALRNVRNPDAPHVARIPTAYERGLAEDPEVVRARNLKRAERRRKQEVA